MNESMNARSFDLLPAAVAQRVACRRASRTVFASSIALGLIAIGTFVSSQWIDGQSMRTLEVAQYSGAPVVAIEHLHSTLVSVSEESKLVVEALRKGRTMSFRSLISDASSTLVVVARFLALLDLYRQGALRFNQVVSLGDLQISWTGAETGEIETTDEFDIPVVLEDEETDSKVDGE